MTAYRRLVWTWVGIIAAGMACGLCAVHVSHWFAIPFFGVVLGSGVLLRWIECPKCGTEVAYDGSIWGRRFNDGGFIHRHCRQCGWDLDKLP